MPSLDAGTATVLAATITAIASILIAYIRSVKKGIDNITTNVEEVGHENRKDHAYVVSQLDHVVKTLNDVRLDTREVKEDVWELKKLYRGHSQELRDHNKRLEEVEESIDNLEEE